MKYFIKSFKLFLFVILLGCQNDDGDSSTHDAQIVAYLSDNDIEATRTSSGLYYTVLFDSSSQTAINTEDVVSFYYKLFDLEKKEIASHQRENGDALQFKIGANAIYPIGLDEAIRLMTLGDIYSFILPPAIGYGVTGSEDIVSETILQIDIEVVNLQQESTIYQDEILRIQSYISNNKLAPVNYNATTNLFYKTTSSGSGDTPALGDLIDIDYTSSFLDTGEVIDKQSKFLFTLGSNEPRSVLSGIELGVAEMKKGETALVFLTSSIAYRESALIIPNFIASDLADIGVIPNYAARIPPYTPLIFALTRND